MINDTHDEINKKINNIRAAGFMIMAVLLFSLTPIFITWGEADKFPFMYNAIRVIFTSIGTVIFLILFYHSQLFSREIWQAILRNWRRWSLAGVIFGVFDYAVFGMSIRHIDVSVASVLFQTWPLWMIFFTSKMFENEQRYENVNRFGWTCILMGFTGLVFVILSQVDEVVLGGENATWLDIFIGVSLASVAAILGALFSGCTIKWGATVLADVPDCKDKISDKELIIFFVLLAFIIASIPSVIIGGTISTFTEHKETMQFNNKLIAAALGLIISVAGIWKGIANVTTTQLEINAISYATPVFTLVFLAMLGYINVPRIDWLIIGTTGIVTAIILLNLKKKFKTRHKYWTAGIWLCGVATHFLLPLI